MKGVHTADKRRKTQSGEYKQWRNGERATLLFAEVDVNSLAGDSDLLNVTHTRFPAKVVCHVHT